MTANVNHTTGIRYGVMQGNSCMELVDEIISRGDNLTFAEHKAQLTRALAKAIADTLEELSLIHISQGIVR